MTVDLLCRVVDNLGDIGFVYRLARALAEVDDPPRLRLVVDDLAAFASICPGVDAQAGYQRVGDWTVTRWATPGPEAILDYRTERPRRVLECYACGRPDWLEDILFDPDDPLPRHIVNLEYLTAEAWAAEFHLLPSLTRSPLVRKTVFMPGFIPGTGGLVIDRAFARLLTERESAARVGALRRRVLSALDGLSANSDQANPPAASPTALGAATVADFWALIFSYEHDFASVVADLAAFHREKPLCAFVAAGRSAAPFLTAWEAADRPFPARELPLLPQTVWDELLVAADFAIVRGEESLARAVLAGHPFLWECYPFSAEPTDTQSAGSAQNAPATGHGGQLPKVYAFLDRLKPYLSPAVFAAYERLTLAFNRAQAAPRGETEPGDLLAVLRRQAPPSETPLGDDLTAGFARFAAEARKRGNLAVNLLTFLRGLG